MHDSTPPPHPEPHRPDPAADHSAADPAPNAEEDTSASGAQETPRAYLVEHPAPLVTRSGETAVCPACSALRDWPP